MNPTDLQKVASKLPLSKSVLARNKDLEYYELSVSPGVTRLEKVTPKRIRQSTKPLLNELETEWLHELEEQSPYASPIIYKQAIRFRLANGAWYKPDFATFLYDTLHCYEVKGPKKSKGVSKGLLTLKVAAAEYTLIKWHLVWKENGIWQEQVVLP